MTDIIKRSTGRIYDFAQVVEVKDLGDGSAVFRDQSRRLYGRVEVTGVSDLWSEVMTAYDFGEAETMSRFEAEKHFGPETDRRCYDRLGSEGLSVFQAKRMTDSELLSLGNIGRKTLAFIRSQP